MDRALSALQWVAYAVAFLALATVVVRSYLRSRANLDRSRHNVLRLRLEAIERGDFSFVEAVPMPTDSTAAEREIERQALENKKRELGL
jgi:heme exporter protein D